MENSIYRTTNTYVIENVRGYGCWDKRLVSNSPIEYREENGQVWINDEPIFCEVVLLNSMKDGYRAIDYINKLFAGEMILIIWVGLGYEILIPEDYENIFKK